MTERCERCGRELNPGDEEWLELEMSTNRYRLPGEVDETDSQGLFPFGKDCKVCVLKASE
jgi:hypothetical protein